MSRRSRQGPACPRLSLPLDLCWPGWEKRSKAEARYRRALVLRPDFAAAWMNLGSLLREQGREVYAEAALRRAVELRPDLIAGWINLAILERERRAACRGGSASAQGSGAESGAGGDAGSLVPVPRSGAGSGRRLGMAALGFGARAGSCRGGEYARHSAAQRRPFCRGD